LRERSDIDKARNEILAVERTRLRTVLAEKKRHIDKLEETVHRLIWQLALALSAVVVLGFLLAVAYREIGRRKPVVANNSARKGA